jgi:hypothetical protein
MHDNKIYIHMYDAHDIAIIDVAYPLYGYVVSMIG